MTACMNHNNSNKVLFVKECFGQNSVAQTQEKQERKWLEYIQKNLVASQIDSIMTYLLSLFKS